MNRDEYESAEEIQRQELKRTERATFEARMRAGKLRPPPSIFGALDSRFADLYEEPRQ